MARGNASVYFIPLLAAMAFLYPVATQRSAVESTPTLGNPYKNAKNTEPGDANQQEWSRGRKAVLRFLNAREGKPALDQHVRPLINADINFLIVTIPDPIDSGLPHAFDRYMASIRQALQTQPYFLSRFDLPWQDCFAGATDQENLKTLDDIKKNPRNECDSHRYRREPGFMLLTNPTARNAHDQADTDRNKGASGDNDTARIDLLLVYLVGETPGSGVNNRALTAALREISWFCGWSKPVDNDSEVQISKRPRACSHSPTTSQVETTDANWQCPRREDRVPQGIRILGPSFSGSAQSIDLALSRWLSSIKQKPLVCVISGSATSIRNSGRSEERDFYFTREKLGSRFNLRSMEIPDTVSKQMFCKYLQSTGLRLPIRIALLTENGTVYGSKEGRKAESAEDLCHSVVDETTIPYPLHISQLRAASEKLRQTQEEAVTTQIEHKALPLADSLADAELRRDIPPFSRADSVTAEQVMASLLSTISQEHYKFVGILATDIRDTMFLAQEVHEHAPASILFTYNTELLYLHSEINSSMRGMLIVGSYPLAMLNQIWSPPWYNRALLQFPDENSEGVYNAALVLLGKPDRLREYGFPFELEQGLLTAPLMPPVWITVVGRGRLWPVNAYTVGETSAKEYTYQLSIADVQTGDPPSGNCKSIESCRSIETCKKSEKCTSIEDFSSLWWRGLYPPHAIVLASVYSTLCISFCLWVLKLIRKLRPRAPNPGGLLPSQGNPAHSRSEGVLAMYRRESLIYFIPACAGLAAFVLPLVASLLIPVIMIVKFGASLRHRWDLLFDHVGGAAAILLCLLSLALLLITVSITLSHIIGKRSGIGSDRTTAVPFRTWGLAALSSGLMFAMAVVVTVTWGLMASSEKLRIFFASIRFLDLQSGVSPLVPLFLISLSGFLWSVVSYHRRRMFEPAVSARVSHNGPSSEQPSDGFLPLRGLRLIGMHDVECEIKRRIKCSPLELPAWWLVAGLILVGSSYIFVVFVRELEHPTLYWLLGVSFLLVSAALWFGVLRFCCIWSEVRRLLRHVACTPLREACKRFQKSYPTLLKLDLASPVPTLTALSHSVEQAFNVHDCARSVAPPLSSPYLIGAARGGGMASFPVIQTAPASPVGSGLLQLGSTLFYQKAQKAEVLLQFAQQAHVNREGQSAADFQQASRGPLAAAAVDASTALDDWWSQPHCSMNKAQTVAPDMSNLCDLAELFLVGRLVHFLGYVFPQLQQLIWSSVAGVLLLLLAVNSYPFPPHDVLVWLNWAVILSLVAIALGVFIQMNRDPIVSYLNGTTPGKINWDREFVLRMFTYGVIPILALLGTQFPDSIGHVISYLSPGQAIHHQ